MRTIITFLWLAFVVRPRFYLERLMAALSATLFLSIVINIPQVYANESANYHTEFKCNIYSPKELNEKEPQKVLKKVLDMMFTCLSVNKERVNKDFDFVIKLVIAALKPYADFEKMSKKVVAQYWSKASKSDREQFMSEFEKIVIRTYSKAFKIFNNQKVEYLNTRISKDKERAEISTAIINTNGEKEKYKVNYRLHQKCKYWQVYDIDVEGLSIVKSFRGQFSDDLRKHGLGYVNKCLKVKNNNKGGEDNDKRCSELI